MTAPISGTSPTADTSYNAALRKAGQDFEALLMEKLLQSSRAAQSGPAADWRAMADRALARDLAKTSPLGIAKMLEPEQ